jgi:hypothetical protein
MYAIINERPENAGECPNGWCSSVRAVGFGAGSVATGAEAHRAVEIAG